MSDPTIRIRVKAGVDGGAMPRLGMPIEHPDTAEDYIISAVHDAPETTYTISALWLDFRDALMLHSGEYLVTARPAEPGEVAAWWEQIRAEDEQQDRRMEQYRREQSWWRRIFG